MWPQRFFKKLNITATGQFLSKSWPRRILRWRGGSPVMGGDDAFTKTSYSWVVMGWWQANRSSFDWTIRKYLRMAAVHIKVLTASISPTTFVTTPKIFKKKSGSNKNFEDIDASPLRSGSCVCDHSLNKMNRFVSVIKTSVRYFWIRSLFVTSCPHDLHLEDIVKIHNWYVMMFF